MPMAWNMILDCRHLKAGGIPLVDDIFCNDLSVKVKQTFRLEIQMFRLILPLISLNVGKSEEGSEVTVLLLK